MHETFERTKAVLVERKDKPGLLGVHRNGGRFVCPLPEGYDGRCSLLVHNGYVIVGHPALPPLLCDPNTGKYQLVEAHHVNASIAGRLRLRTA